MFNKKNIVLLSILFLVISCGNEVKENVEKIPEINEISNTVNEDTDVNKNTIVDANENRENGLSESENEWLLLMREEEKLARDVYSYLYEVYNQNIFWNIDDAEEKHKSAVLPLLEQFWLEDPIFDDTPWIFNSTEMDKLYKDLTEAWDVSLVEALKIGMTIEDLDIKDLNELLAGTTNEDIIRVYDNLLKWSYNHLRAFMKNLERKGWTYTPQFISQEEFDEILGN